MIALTSDVSTWPEIFDAASVDYVPDPMVLRAAELFIGGRQYCIKEQKLDDQKAWPVIENNIDGILAFFHALMTRERIPLIDYEYTFPSMLFTQRLGEITEPIHPPYDVYTNLKSDALQKLGSFDSSRLPAGALDDLGQELFAVGYSWMPSLQGLEIGEAHKKAATFILGALIFGGYAQAGGADHLLQNRRASMFVALSLGSPMPTAKGIAREKRLFAALNRLANRDEHLHVELEEAPPNVLHHLVAQGVSKTGELLEGALRLRDSPEGRDYRDWHSKLRRAWSHGFQNEALEKDVAEVTKEFKRRLSGKPTTVTKLTVGGSAKARVGGHVGIAEASARINVRAKPQTFNVTIPNKIRNWYVDSFVLSRHQKLLLEMSLDRRSFFDLAGGLKAIWERS